jgi:HEPN domain-containing protein
VSDARIAAAVRQWVQSARNDRTAVTLLQAAGGPRPVIAFHAQQAVEKLLKALLVSYGVEPFDSHDVGALVTQLHRLDAPTAGALGVVERLTRYAVETRYPPRPGRAGRVQPAGQVDADVTLAVAACAALDGAIEQRLTTLDPPQTI